MKRVGNIDFLRAVAIYTVIVTHVFSYNLTDKLNFFIWNYSHFEIVAFIFCSGYIMFAQYNHKFSNSRSIFIWYKKRLMRLLLPLYYYLGAHFLLMLLFPKFFSGLGLRFSPGFILQSIFLIGGISLNWLPLLFLELAIIFPLLLFLLNRIKIIFWIYVVCALLITFGFTVWQVPYQYYRETMWIPWSIFLIIPWYFYKKQDKSVSNMAILYLFISAVSLILFNFLNILWSHLGRSVTLIDNKYPPNLFYISFEVFGSFLLLGISFVKFFRVGWIIRIYQYISKNSYSLFFIHYIVLDFTLSVNKTFKNHIGVWWQLTFVLVFSIAITWVLKNFLTKFAIIRLVLT